MRTFSILFACLFSAVSLIAQKSTNLVKTINPDEASAVLFDFNNKSISLKNWEDETKLTLRIRLEIHANMPQAIMSQLVKANRYQVNATMNDDGNYLITMPNLEKKISVGGTDLEDEIFVRVDAPQDFFLDGKTLNRGIMIAGRAGGKPSLDTRRKMKIDKNQIEKAKEEIEIIFVELSPAVLGSVKEKLSNNKVSKKGARKHSMIDASSAMSLQELKAQYGEILIDGVIFEIE